MAKVFEDTRTKNNPTNVDLSLGSLRSIVLADAGCSQRALKKNGNSFNNYGYARNDAFPSPHSSKFGNSEIHWSQEERVRTTSPNGSSATMTSVQRTNPHKNHKGDCRVDFSHSPQSDPTPKYITDQGVGSYPWIISKLNSVASTLNQQKGIAQLFLNLGDTCKTPSNEELKNALECEEISPDLLKKFKKLQSFLLNDSASAGHMQQALQEVKSGKGSLLSFIETEKVTAELKENIELFGALLPDENPLLQKKFASLLLRNLLPSKQFRPIKADHLNEIGIVSSTENLQFLNDLYYLLFVKEISRRRNPEEIQMDLPYALSLIQSLKLVGNKGVNGEVISFSKILDSGNQGLLFFTGGSIVKDNSTKPAVDKIERLGKHFQAAFPEESQQITTPSGSGKMLSRYYGGASDTDEDQYEQL